MTSVPAVVVAPSQTRHHLIASAILIIGTLSLYFYVTVSLAILFAHGSAQMDFDQFYTAGRAVRAGLDPYQNNYFTRPRVWDGVTTARTTGFIYTPFAAWLFASLAALPYAEVKLLWSLAQSPLLLLAGVGATLWIGRGTRTRIFGISLLFLWAALFFPLWFEIERGQIDVVLLLGFIAAGLLCDAPLSARYSRWGPIIAGMLLAATAFVKLHMLFLLPLLLLRGRWRTAIAAALTLPLIWGLQTLLLPGLTHAYATQDLPRIAHYGAQPPPGTPLSSIHMPVNGTWLIQGISYEPQAQGLLSGSHPVNASLARALLSLFPGASYTLLSLAVVAVLLGLIVICVPSRVYRALAPGVESFTFWLAGLCVVLLAAPLTWTMNLVWLLCAIPLLLVWPRRSAWLLLLVGLLLATAPDATVVSVLSVLPMPLAAPLFALKYVLSVLLVFIACLLQLHVISSRHQEHGYASNECWCKQNTATRAR